MQKPEMDNLDDELYRQNHRAKKFLQEAIDEAIENIDSLTAIPAGDVPLGEQPAGDILAKDMSARGCQTVTVSRFHLGKIFLLRLGWE
ncbi:MAG: hypothetical protein R2865_12860 [Deinococcales bacterium]